MFLRLTKSHEPSKLVAGTTIPIVVGLAVMCVGGIGMFAGGLGLSAQGTEAGQIRTTMSLIGGVFLFLTGLWFMTRSRPTPVRLIGLGWMVTAVVLGTYWGKAIATQYADEHVEMTNTANIVFVSGLLLHLMGVVYVVLAKE